MIYLRTHTEPVYFTDNTTRNMTPEPSALTHNTNFDPPMKEIVMDKHERILLEKQNIFKICLKNPKSLSLSDLTKDDQKQSTKRPQSAPPAHRILDYSCVSPSIAFGFYFDDYLQVDEEPQVQNIKECTTDCETSEDEYGNVNEGRKRHNIAKKDEWKKLKAQRKRMRGEEYLGYSKPQNEKMRQDQIRPAKQMGEACSSDFCRKSKFRGCNHFEEEIRQSIHTYFWKNLNWGERKMYVRGHVNRTRTTQKTKGEELSRREGTLSYFLPKPGNEGKIQVCKQMFLNTLSLKPTTVQMWVKDASFNVDAENQENSQVNRQNAKMLALNNYFKSIPKMPSHYARKDTRKLYLEPVYRTISDVFNAYKQHCNNINIPAVSRYTFDKSFKHNNLALYTLKKDMCDICVGHKEGNIDEHIYQEHLIKKNRAREEKAKDKEDAALGHCILLTMDLESVKVCPYSTASALYFKTKLTCHNFTLFDLTTRHCTCYWFTETAADLTASTFASFVIDYLERHCLSKKMPIIIYSDGCTYQNRNVVMANALLNLSIKHKITITQKFLERGHTQMECDSVHSAIERKLSNRVIHLPCDYVSATKEARASNPYEVIQIDHNFVKNYADTSTWLYKTIRPGRKAGDPTVTDLRAILYNQEDTIKVKLHFHLDWFALPQRQKRFNPDVSYLALHNNMIPITASKYQHLQELKQVLPSECHNFYDTLPHL